MQFILTGSASPSDDISAHTGAGRIARMTLRTMSLAESNESIKAVNFNDLFMKNTQIGGLGGIEIEDYAKLIVRGGLPVLINETCLIIEGDVTVKYGSESVSFTAGGYVVFPKGLSCVWQVKKPVKKYGIVKLV